jgi:hypothetical protein
VSDSTVEPAPDKRGDSGVKGVWHALGNGWKIFGLVVALAAGTLTLRSFWDTFFPPSPSATVTTPASVALPAENVRYATFRVQHPADAGSEFASVSEPLLGACGDVYTIGVALGGPHSLDADLSWFPVSATSGQQLGLPARTPTHETLHLASGPRSFRIWIPSPTGKLAGTSGTFYESFTLSWDGGKEKTFATKTPLQYANVPVPLATCE